jgi:hypothetical protein
LAADDLGAHADSVHAIDPGEPSLRGGQSGACASVVDHTGRMSIPGQSVNLLLSYA